MPFVQPTNVAVSFQGGLQSKTDDFQVSPGSLLELQNANFDKIGKLNKRFGYDILTTNIMDGNIITSAVAIDNFNNELNLFDNQNIYTYISANGNWANRGPAISLINSNNQIIRSSAAQQLNPDCAFLSDIKVFAWEDSRGTVRYSVLDHSTNSYCVSDESIPGSLTKPKTIVFNGLIYILYTSKNNLYYRTIDTDNPNIITAQLVFQADGDTDFVYDVFATSDRLYLAYFQDDGSGNHQIGLSYLTTAGSVVNVATFDNPAIADANYTSIAITVDSLDQVWVCWSTGAVVKYRVYNTSGSVILSTTVIDTVQAPAMTVIESNTAGVAHFVYERVNTPPSVEPGPDYIASAFETIRCVTLTNDAVITEVGTKRTVGLASKAFKYGQNIYVNTIHDSPLQSTYFTLLITTSNFGTIVGKVNAQVGGDLSTNGMLPSITTIDSGVFLWPNLVKGRFISEDNTTFSLLGVNSTITDFTNINKFNSVTQSNNLLFVGGILQSYDGSAVVEQNFHLYPEGILRDQFDGSGGALSAGQYQYQAVYSWTDKFGQIQYSSPSPALTVSFGSPNSSCRLHVPSLALTSKDNVVIKIYRTEANGTVFHEITSELAPLLSDTSADFTTFLDTVADADILANALIYTTGGVLPNTSPPSCSLISLYRDRVVVSGLEDPNLIWYSKNKFDNSNFNTIPPEFSSSLTIAVSQTGGPITALGLMDDKLIIFKKSSIFVLTGDGPNDTGSGESFSTPELVTNSIGCTNPNSVVLMKDGIMFQSDKGIWLLDRGLGPPSYIGAGVDDDAKNYVVSSATIDPNDNLIIFTTFQGPALVYDYFVQQWSTYTNHQSIDSLVFNGVFTFCKDNGQIYTQNRTKYTDGENKIRMEFITPWMSAAGMQGYQRIFRSFLLGQFKGPHSLDVAVSYDFNPDFPKTATIDATAVAGANQWGGDDLWGDSTPWGGDYLIYQFQINFDRQTCTSFRLKISDDQDSNYNEGYTISSLSFEIGVLPGHNRLPIRNKAGTR